mgnify:CR=1 FL=1
MNLSMLSKNAVVSAAPAASAVQVTGKGMTVKSGVAAGALVYAGAVGYAPRRGAAY